MESLFDDEFDPRADERKKAEERRVKDEFGLDPFGDTFMVIEYHSVSDI